MGEIARLMAVDMPDDEIVSLVEQMTPLWARTPDGVLRSSMERVAPSDLRGYLGFLERAQTACLRARSGVEALAQIARRAEIARGILEPDGRA